MRIGIVLFSFGFVFVLASAIGVPIYAAPLDRIKDMKENRVTRIENKCERVTSRIDEKIAKYDADHKARIDRYNKLKSSVQEKVTKAEGNGKDVTKLKADLITLDTMIQKLSTDYATYIEKLRLTKNYACGNSEGQFIQALKDARTAQKLVWQDAKDLLRFVQGALKTDLKALR